MITEEQKNITEVGCGKTVSLSFLLSGVQLQLLPLHLDQEAPGQKEPVDLKQRKGMRHTSTEHLKLNYTTFQPVLNKVIF